jgi:DNA primase
MTDIDEVKTRLNIVDIISSKVALKKAGRNFKGLCPFHGEKTPSFMVSPERQTFHCFGCGKGGSVIDFVMEYEHVDFIEALETLAEKAGVTLTRRFDETPQAKQRVKILEVNHLASEYYHYILTKHKLGQRALSYLKNRGVSDKTIETFMIGYSPASWDGLLKFLRKKGYADQLLSEAGLIVPSDRGGYDRFRGRVMFPLKDHRGNVVGFSGRVLDPTVKEAKYINTSETPVYIKGNMLFALDITKGAIQKENEAIIMEGEFDVISSWQEGVSNVVAIKGSALTEGHVNLLKRFTDRIIFCLDSDLAGDAASRRGIEIADKAGMDLKVVVIPQGKDPDESVRENPVEFKKAVKNAIPIYDYFIQSAGKRFDITTAYGVKKISEELLPIISAIDNPVIQAHYVKKLADILHVSEDTVIAGMKRIKRNKMLPEKTEKEVKTAPALTRPEKMELYVLALILQTNTVEYWEEFRESIELSEIASLGVRQIFAALEKFLPTHQPFFIRDFADTLPQELVSILDQAFLLDLSEFIDNPELLARVWLKTLRELKKIIIKNKLKDISAQVNSDNTAGGTDVVSQSNISETIAKLTQELRTLEKAEAI